jgi:hypothetical protein
MSFDIFLTTFEDYEPGKFDRSIVERAFEPLIADRDEGLWYLQTPEGERVFGTLSIDDGPEVSGFSVNRPPFMPSFWSAIFEVLRQTHTFLFWPGEDPYPTYCVANPDFAARLPPEFVKDCGGRSIITCGAEIEAAINLCFS